MSLLLTLSRFGTLLFLVSIVDFEQATSYLKYLKLVLSYLISYQYFPLSQSLHKIEVFH